jgi:hypothetical protein
MEEQKSLVETTIRGEKYEPNRKKVGPWFTKAKDGSYQFFISWAHDKLDFKPGMKTIKAADLNGLIPIVTKCIELVKANYFKPQMDVLSASLAAALKAGKATNAAEDEEEAEAARVFSNNKGWFLTLLLPFAKYGCLKIVYRENYDRACC